MVAGGLMPGEPFDWARGVNMTSSSWFEPQAARGLTEVQAEEIIRVLHDIAQILRTAYRIPAPYIAAESDPDDG